MTSLPPVFLRKATVDDIGFVMSTERQPGFDWFVGTWDTQVHQETLANPANAYLIGLDEAGRPAGFAILRDLHHAEGNVYLQRIAAVQPSHGFGGRLLRAVTDFVFRETGAFRFWLHMKAGNEHAHAVYRREGFTEEGVLRQSHINPAGARADAHIFSKLRPEWSCPTASAST